MPERNLVILVIDQSPSRALIIEEGLKEAGHHHVHTTTEVVGVARVIEGLRPDVIVINLENPNRDLLESMFLLSRSVRRPIAMFVDRTDKVMIEAAVDAGVSAYIVDGLKRERVKSILDMAIIRFNAYSRMADELQSALGELENRKIIDRAKAILMRTRGLSEDEAYSLLRKTAMSMNKKMGEVAQSLVLASSLLEG
ncbi:MAG: ANTAR domain-containing response regulator [Allorhizobium sp.]